MRVIRTTPTRAYIEGEIPAIKMGMIRQELTYRDKSIQFDLKRLENQLRYAGGPRAEILREEIEDLKSKMKVCLLFEDETGRWTYSGLGPKVARILDCPFENKIYYPSPKDLPWSEKPKYKMYPYQEESMEKLIATKHAGVELATGLGKTFIILNIARYLGLKTVIMTPSTNISEQIYELFHQHLGKKYVGKYWGGKKEAKKLIVIGNGQSFTRVQPGSEDWKLLNEAKVFIADESHQTPADTLSRVCTGVLADAPSRS